MKCLDSALDEVVNSKPEGVVDIDAEETDYLQCKEYAQDQVDYLQQLERRWKFTKNYLTDKDHVKPSMRAVLVDWLIQVQVRTSAHITITKIKYLLMFSLKILIL